MADVFKKITETSTFDSSSTTESIGTILGITEDTGGGKSLKQMRLEDIKNICDHTYPCTITGDYIQSVTLNTLYSESEADNNSEACYLQITLGNLSSSEDGLNFLEELASSTVFYLSICNAFDPSLRFYTTNTYSSSYYKWINDSSGKLASVQIIFLESGERDPLSYGHPCTIKGLQKDFTFSLPSISSAYKIDRIVCQIYL